jgi:hypothetical protein
MIWSRCESGITDTRDEVCEFCARKPMRSQTRRQTWRAVSWARHKTLTVAIPRATCRRPPRYPPPLAGEGSVGGASPRWFPSGIKTPRRTLTLPNATASIDGTAIAPGVQRGAVLRIHILVRISQKRAVGFAVKIHPGEDRTQQQSLLQIINAPAGPSWRGPVRPEQCDFRDPFFRYPIDAVANEDRSRA